MPAVLGPGRERSTGAAVDEARQEGANDLIDAVEKLLIGETVELSDGMSASQEDLKAAAGVHNASCSSSSHGTWPNANDPAVLNGGTERTRQAVSASLRLRSCLGCSRSCDLPAPRTATASRST